MCHTRFAFRTVSRRCDSRPWLARASCVWHRLLTGAIPSLSDTRSLSRLERLSNAVQLHKRWLLRVTAGCLCVCALCAVFFSLLQLHVLPTEQFARDGVFLVGAGALFVLLGCWRYVLAVQPSVDSVRVLLSAPEGEKGRRPLMQFVSGDAVAVPVASTPRTDFLTWLGLMPAAPALPPWLDNGGEALEPPSASTTADLSLQREWAMHRALDSAASAFDLTDMMRHQRSQQLALATDVESGAAPLAPDQQ